MLTLLRTRLPEAAKAVAPLVGVVCVLQMLFVQAPVALFVQFLAGSLLAMLGMLLLFAGIEVGILPMGRFIGAELPRKGSIWLIVGVAFAELDALSADAAPRQRQGRWVRFSSRSKQHRTYRRRNAIVPRSPGRPAAEDIRRRLRAHQGSRGAKPAPPFPLPPPNAIDSPIAHDDDLGNAMAFTSRPVVSTITSGVVALAPLAALYSTNDEAEAFLDGR